MGEAGRIVCVIGLPGFVSWHLCGEETTPAFMTGGNGVSRSKTPTELRPLSSHRDWKREQELSLSVCFS